MNAGGSEPRKEGLSPGANESGRGSRGDVSWREGGSLGGKECGRERDIYE